eukprot:m51a1_g3564 putative mitogen-activated protein kinase (549) ;mRNA; r:1062287-1071539
MLLEGTELEFGPDGGHTLLQEAAATLCLGLHPRLGSRSPVSVLDAHTLSLFVRTLRRALFCKYRIDQRIGRGAYSEMYIATDVDRGRQVALKHLCDALRFVDGAREAAKEVVLSSRLSHHNVVTVERVHAEPGDPPRVFLVREYFPTDLMTVIRADILEPLHVQYIMYQILCALKYLHSAGLVLWRVYPGSFLINQECTVKVSGLTDVHVVGLLPEQPDPVFGNSWYRSPERLLGMQTRELTLRKKLMLGSAFQSSAVRGTPVQWPHAAPLAPGTPTGEPLVLVSFRSMYHARKYDMEVIVPTQWRSSRGVTDGDVRGSGLRCAVLVPQPARTEVVCSSCRSVVAAEFVSKVADRRVGWERYCFRVRRTCQCVGLRVSARWHLAETQAVLAVSLGGVLYCSGPFLIPNRRHRAGGLVRARASAAASPAAGEVVAPSPAEARIRVAPSGPISVLVRVLCVQMTREEYDLYAVLFDRELRALPSYIRSTNSVLHEVALPGGERHLYMVRISSHKSADGVAAEDATCRSFLQLSGLTFKAQKIATVGSLLR